MPEKITSLHNERIKAVVKLRDRRERDLRQLTIVEGWKEVAAALAANVEMREIFLCPEFGPAPEQISRLIAQKNIPVYETNAAVFEKINYGERREGGLALVAPRLRTWEDLPDRGDSWFIAVESVEKPGNLGAILRTVDAVGADGLIVCDPKTDIFNPNVVRSSLGTVFTVPVVIAASQDAALKMFRKRQLRIFAAVPDAEKVYTENDLTGKAVFLVGSESEGLSPFWLKAADVRLRIPMAGQADSLNVSVAAAVIAYESLRQRNEKGDRREERGEKTREKRG
ncbi:MAG: RNA methyltransferase [Candidatus Omnitrophica bacterium]|nr:RNA methyltransferase [Candidatus Omnitrophota bacterium]